METSHVNRSLIIYPLGYYSLRHTRTHVLASVKVVETWWPWTELQYIRAVNRSNVPFCIRVWRELSCCKTWTLEDWIVGELLLENEPCFVGLLWTNVVDNYHHLGKWTPGKMAFSRPRSPVCEEHLLIGAAHVSDNGSGGKKTIFSSSSKSINLTKTLKGVFSTKWIYLYWV